MRTVRISTALATQHRHTSAHITHYHNQDAVARSNRRCCLFSSLVLLSVVPCVRADFGELDFWTGSFVAGLPAIATGGVPIAVRVLRGACALLGLSGIYFIMLSATKRLEGRQAEKYRPSSKFDTYYKSTNALMPRLVNVL